MIVRDSTIHIQQMALADLEKKFNAAKFEKGKSELSVNAKFILYDISRLLTNYPEMRLTIIGHTSKEGSDEINLRLSNPNQKTYNPKAKI